MAYTIALVKISEAGEAGMAFVKKLGSKHIPFEANQPQLISLVLILKCSLECGVLHLEP